MAPEQAGNTSSDSAVGRGTDDRSVADPRAKGDFAQFQNATIMMVDDEPVFIDVVRTFLEITGYRKFIKVEYSYEATDKVREHRPDMLLLGITMPGRGGFDILKTLRDDPDFASLPILVVTSSTDASFKFQALDLGATDFLSKPVDPSELALRVRNTLAARAYQGQLALFDGLTGLPGRELFHDRVDSAIARAHRERTKLVLMHVTFDDFARVTDELGPQAGDEILKQLARRLNSQLRASDSISLETSDNDARPEVFRLRRAEFSVVLPAVKSVTGAAAIGQRLLAAIGEPLHAEGAEIRLKSSIGISGFPDDAEDAATLIKLAMGASRLALAQGGGRLQFSSSAMNQASRQWLRMEEELRRAVTNGELRLLYQPKIDAKNGTVVGAEALMRWPRTDGICVSPSDFISVAEETDMIQPISEWTLREACRQAVQWREQGVDIKVAVNISAIQFFRAELAPLVRTVLEETGLEPRMLTLEITESIVIDRVRQALAILDELRAVGVTISIDDFGTGYSSMSFLKRFKADEVKIDKTLVANVVSSSKDRALVYAITHLAHQFGFAVCAEGVEDDRQREILKELKCDRYQGFLFDRPLDPKSFVTRYRAKQVKAVPDDR